MALEADGRVTSVARSARHLRRTADRPHHVTGFSAPLLVPGRGLRARGHPYRCISSQAPPRVQPWRVATRMLQGSSEAGSSQVFRAQSAPAGGTPDNVFQSAAVPDTSLGSGGSGAGGDAGDGSNRRNGGSGGGGDGSREDASGDGDPDSPPNAEIAALLASFERSYNSLSPDVRSAVNAGRIGRDMLHKVLTVEHMPLFGALIRAWPSLRNRLVANSRFPLQLGVELAVGMVTKTLAEVGMRGDRFWKEFDFYTSDMALEIFGDTMLVWLLSPAAMFAAPARSGTLSAILQSLPKHMLQAGPYTSMQRTGSLLYKGAQFALVGFLSSLVGHGLTTALVAQRRARVAAASASKRGHAADYSEEVELAPVLPTSMTWGGFMFCSSNPRYQFVNGLEQRIIFPLLEQNALLAAVVSFAVRFGNSFVGGVHWIPFARFFGIQ